MGKEGVMRNDGETSNTPSFATRTMKKIFTQHRLVFRLASLGIAFLVTFLASAAIANLRPGYTGLGTSNIPFTSLTFTPLGAVDGPLRAIAFGDPTKGEHGFYLKLPPQWQSPNHYHSADYHAVLIDGEIVNSYEGQTKEIKIGKGGYFSTVNNVNHVTKCLSKTECIIYVQMNRAFDAPPAWQSGVKTPS
jgi:beta-alanine degradation protein BauB